MSNTKRTEIISRILTIASAVLMAFATVFMIVCMVKCKSAMKGVTDEDALSAISKQYGTLSMFVGIGCFGVSIVINLASVMMYVNIVGYDDKKDTIAIFKILYVFLPMVLYVLLLLIQHWVC